MPGAGEEGGLHPGVAEQIQSDPVVGLGCEDADADEEQTGVGDGGVGEQALDVALVPAHEGADRGRQHAEHDEEAFQVVGRDAAGPGEHGAVHPPDTVRAEFDHDAGEHHAHRGGGDGMRVGQPEVEGHGGGLDQQPGQDEDERGEDERVGRSVRVEAPSDLCHRQLAGAGVEQGDAHEQGVGAEGGDDGEGEGTLHRPGLLDPVAGEGVGAHAHQLEPHEGVEQVAREREAAHARLEEEHQGGEGAGVPARGFVEVVPGVGERREGQQRGERGHAEARAVADEDDPDALAVHGNPAADPLDHGR